MPLNTNAYFMTQNNNDRLAVDLLEKSRNDVNENVGIITINCEKYVSSKYVSISFSEVQQYNSTILDSGVIYPCNVDIPL